MGKRTKVPAALHSELSEYASLLRALRTNNTLDLASQLTLAPTASPASSYQDEHVQPVLGDEGESELPLTETTTDLHTPAEGSVEDEDAAVRRLKRRAKKTSKAKSKTPRDNWTRWPLLAGDVHVPEWSLEDEVRLLATQCLKTQLDATSPSSSGPSGPDVGGRPGETLAEAPPEHGTASPVPANSIHDEVEPDEEDAVDSLLSPPVIGALTASSGQFLSQVLALLAAYVPPGEKSMQNRMRPINWESVLDIVAVNGLAHESTLENVRHRLSTIYPPSSHAAQHNFLPDHSLRDSSVNDLSFLEIEGYEPPNMKRKRGPYQKRIRLPHERASKRPKSESMAPEG